MTNRIRRLRMAKKIELPGCLYKRGDRWYWKVQLPGEPRFKIRPMIAITHSEPVPTPSFSYPQWMQSGLL